MLYLEDYLEMIEHLPQELRDRFTEMRELDLTVQNSMDSLEKKTRTFFQQCKRGELQNEACEAEFQNLRKEYYKVLEDADEKVAIATQIHELVERYLRRLDSELFKFKCELEADNNGITEILEKRSLEMDGGSSAATALLNVLGVNQKENRYFGSVGATAGSNSHGMISVAGGSSSGAASLGNITLPSMPTSAIKESRYRPTKVEKRRDSMSNVTTVPEKRPNLVNNMSTNTTLNVAVVCPIKPGVSGTHAALLNAPTATVASPAATVTYNLQQLGAGGAASNAIAAAASQAIVATQQMQQGRRTASLKASFEAIHGAGGGPTEFWISRDIANAAAAATVANHNTMQQNTSTNEKKQKKKITSTHTYAATGSSTSSNIPTALSIASSSSSLSVDSVDMLPTVGGLSNVISSGNVSTLGGLQNVASASSVSNNRAGSASSVNSTTTVLTPTSNLGLNDNGLFVEQTNEGEWSYDPNEPRYCTCNQVSYGDMVACDNEACPYEWFHYPCVGITQPPKGKWYCPKCTASMRRRNRKN